MTNETENTMTWWFIYALFLAVLVCSIGCCEDAGGFPDDQKQDMAVQIALGVYSAPSSSPLPPVTWIEGADLNCQDRLGDPGWIYKGVCLAGKYTSPTILTRWDIQVSRNPRGLQWGALAHEVAHAINETRGNSDQNHMGPMFCDAGEVGPCNHPGGMLEHGLVGLANRTIDEEIGR